MRRDAVPHPSPSTGLFRWKGSGMASGVTCERCGRSFRNGRGLAVHQRTCKGVSKAQGETTQASTRKKTETPPVAPSRDVRADVPVPGSHKDYAQRRREYLMSLQSRGYGPRVVRR